MRLHLVKGQPARPVRNRRVTGTHERQHLKMSLTKLTYIAEWAWNTLTDSQAIGLLSRVLPQRKRQGNDHSPLIHLFAHSPIHSPLSSSNVHPLKAPVVPPEV